MSRRTQRLGEQLKREVSQILRSEVHDPRVTGVTVTGVDVAPDLTYARVWVQIVGDDAGRERALEGLSAAAPFVRRRLGAELSVRRVPELDFRVDLTLERAMRIERLLRESPPPPEPPEEDQPEGEPSEEDADREQE